MTYVASHLMSGERLVAMARLHWLIFVRPVLWLLMSLAVLLFRNVTAEPVVRFTVIAIAGLIALRGLYKLAFVLIDYWSSEFAVTNKRLLVKVGLIRRSSLELLLSKVETIGVEQTILGRLLNYGTIVISGTGGSQDRYDTIGGPMEFRKIVQEQIASSQDRVAPPPLRAR